MDQILEQTLKLALLIRDSKEAGQWRETLHSLKSLHFEYLRFSKDEVYANSPEAFLGAWVDSNSGTNPLLLLGQVLENSMHGLSYEEKIRQLQGNPIVKPFFRVLNSTFMFSLLLGNSLRQLGAGFPHEYLIYSLDKFPWSKEGESKYLPFFNERISFEKVNHWQNHIPSILFIFCKELETLANLVSNHSTCLRLKETFSLISHNEVLKNKLRNIRNQAQMALEQAGSSDKVIWLAVSHELEKTIYLEAEASIQEYVNAFLDFEQLIERIYRMISHIVIQEQLLCVLDNDRDQAQQFYLHGKYLSIICGDKLSNLKMNSIIHFTLPKSNTYLDGFYQIKEANIRFDNIRGYRSIVQMERVWTTPLEPLKNIDKDKFKKSLFTTIFPDYSSI